MVLPLELKHEATRCLLTTLDHREDKVLIAEDFDRDGQGVAGVI